MIRRKWRRTGWGAWAGLLLLAATACSFAADEFRGLWVDSYHAGFRNAKEVDRLISDARAGHFNALLVEVRRRGDAYYNSHLEPKADDVSPRTFDPLADLISKAHDTNAGPRLEIHAWMVTYPIWDHHTTSPTATNHPYVLHPDWLTRDNDGDRWNGVSYVFDPGHPAVQQHTFDVAMDIVTNYDIDGLNLDYIRYGGVMWGYNPVSVARFDEAFERKGMPSPTDPQWMQWRRDQVTDLVRKIYLSAIAFKPRLKISADTICFAPGVTTTTGWTHFSAAYTSVLQDWRSWMEEGILDLNIPMTYFEQTGNHQQSWANWNLFIKNHRYGRQAAIGPGAYLNGISNTLAQIRLAREPTPEGNSAEGVSLYSYNTLTRDGGSRAEFFSALTQAEASRRIEHHDQPVFADSVSPPEMTWKTAPTNGYLAGTLALNAGPIGAAPETIELDGPIGTQFLTPDATQFFGVARAVPGGYRLIVTGEGYHPVVTNITVIAGLVSRFALRLNPIPAGTAPSIALQPVRQSGLVGDSVRFRSIDSGSPPVFRQWVFNGRPVPGATNSILSWRSIDFPQAGNYALVLSNAFGMVTSDVAQLVVTAPEGIYALRASAGLDSALISWRTSEPTFATVTYSDSTLREPVEMFDWTSATNHTIRLAELLPNTTYSVRVVSRAPATNFVRKGIEVRTGGDVVVDNTAASFSGGWSTGASAGGKYGSDYRFAGTLRTAATSRATFTPEIAVPGRYDIAVWNPRGSNRSTNVSFVIDYERGVMSRVIDQTRSGGQWHELADDVTLARGTSGSVSLSNATGEFGRVVVADAVRFHYETGQESPAGDALPIWWVNHFFDRNEVDGNADPDRDLYSNHEEFLLGSDPLDPASSIHADAQLTEDGNVRITFYPVQPDRAYRLEATEQLDPPHWEELPAERPSFSIFTAGLFITKAPAYRQLIYRVVAEIPEAGPPPAPVEGKLD